MPATFRFRFEGCVEKTSSMSISNAICSICDAITVMTICMMFMFVYLFTVSFHRFSIVRTSIHCAHISSIYSLRYGADDARSLARSIFNQHQMELRKGRKQTESEAINIRVERALHDVHDIKFHLIYLHSSQVTIP